MSAEVDKRDNRVRVTLLERRALVALYWGAAAVLAPWIVILYGQQRANGVARHVHVARVGIAVIIVAGMLLTAAGCWKRWRATVIFATTTATLAFVTAWFATVTARGHSFDVALASALLVLLPVVTICAWIAVRVVREPYAHRELPTVIAPLLIVGAVAFIPLMMALSGQLKYELAVHHLRVVWTGLDVLELIGLLATGWCLHRGSRGVVIAATFTGSLLFCDAWFNVVATTGAVQVAGALMALVELPLAALSFFVAAKSLDPA